MGEPSDVSMCKILINMKGSDITYSSAVVQGLNALQVDCESEWKRFHKWLIDKEELMEAA